MSISNELLKMGIQELKDKNKISTDMKTEMDTYVDNLSHFNVLEVEYNDFNQTSSTGVTWDDAARTVSWDTGNAELITNAIAASSVKLLALKLKATDQNIDSIQISYDLTEWYDIDDYDTNEDVGSNTSFYLKIKFSATNDIKGILIMTEPSGVC